MTESPSVTRFLAQLRSDDRAARDEAARQIWQHYFPLLLELARCHLDRRLRRRVDEEDVLQSMYNSFCMRQERGEYLLGDSRDLWRLLVTMTLNKVRSAAARQMRGRRDYRREEAAPAAGGSLPPEWAFEQMEQAEPTPADAAAFTEEIQLRLTELPEPLRQIALWKLQGYTNEEIASAAMLGCSVRTVERKLNLIREKWAGAAD
jgi:RNA polymerase sigma factor (sigma-70 family)